MRSWGAIKSDQTPGPDELIFKGRFGTRLAEGGLRCACNRINPDIAVHAFRSCFSDWVGDRTDASEEMRELCEEIVAALPEGEGHPGLADFEKGRRDFTAQVKTGQFR